MASPALRESKELQQRIEGPLGDVVTRPSAANRSEYERRLDELGELGGLALAAAGEVQAGVTRFGRSYNPLLQWRDPFRTEGGMASAEEVVDSCDRSSEY